MRPWIFASVVCGIVAYLATNGLAQAILGPKGPYSSTAEKLRQPGDPDVVYRLTVTPAAEPELPLEYSLYPRSYERQPGNAALKWHRVLAQLRELGSLSTVSEHWNEWMGVSIDEMPLGEIRPFLEGLERPLAEAREAALCEQADWGLRIGELRGPETIQVLLTEFQQARNISRILNLRARLRILDGNFEAAQQDVQTSYRLAHDVAEPLTAIHDLIGCAVDSDTTAAVRDWIDAPGSPNLYWALAQIPQPLIDIKPAIEAEMTLAERYFPWLAEPQTPLRTPEQWRPLFHETVREVWSLQEARPRIHQNTPNETVDLVLLGLAMRVYPTAKRDLVEWGWSPDEVEAMPVGLALALHEERIYRRVSQAAVTSLLLPYQTGQRHHQETQARHRALRYLEMNPWQARTTFGLAAALMPALQQVRTAVERREATRAALMVIEAVRMHLAQHDGQLPRTLKDITAVPVPDNPSTGEPFAYELRVPDTPRPGELFAYELRDGTAVIDVPFPYFLQRFEITVEPSSENSTNQP